MSKPYWRKALTQLARGERLSDALGLFDHIEDEQEPALHSREKARVVTVPVDEDSLFVRETRRVTQLIAKWSVNVVPPGEELSGIAVDVSQPDQVPLVIGRTTGGEVFLFDAIEVFNSNADHKALCMHVEAYWADWQDEPAFIPLFCQELAMALTTQGLPEPEYIF